MIDKAVGWVVRNSAGKYLSDSFEMLWTNELRSAELFDSEQRAAWFGDKEGDEIIPAELTVKLLG